MKTPRQILSERHQAANPKLDALRQSVVAGLMPEQAGTRAPVESTTFAEKIWLELILPCRRLWIGLAAAWLVIIGAHFITLGGAPQMTLAKTSPPTPEVLTVLKEQKQMLAQLLGPMASPPALPVPGPRSQRHEEFYAV